MTQEEEGLLLQDLCARLPYGVKCYVPVENCIMELTGKRLNYFCFHKKEWGIDYSHELEVVLDPLNDAHNGYIVKPYLRPMSSMTEDEKNKFQSLQGYFYGEKYIGNNEWENTGIVYYNTVESLDWLNANHFDYRHLIEKGLALKATKDMYKTK